MAINKELLGPQDQSEHEVFAIETLVFSVQIALQKAMNQHGVSNKVLAERLGMSPARVSQVFSTNGPNLTLKTIARIAHALGEDFEFVTKCELATEHVHKIKATLTPINVRPQWVEMNVGNNNERPLSRLAVAC